MAVTKLTFDEALNTAKNDAYFNWYLTNKTNGIFKDLGNACEASASNGSITFKDGFVSVYGRRVYIENGTSITITLNETKKGYVVLKVDTINNKAEILLHEGTSSNYPTLTQEDLLEQDGVFELPLVGYSKTTTTLTLDKSCISYISTNKEELTNTSEKLSDALKQEVNTLNSTIKSKQHGLQYVVYYQYSRSNNTIKFDITSVMSKDSVILSFAFCNNIISISLDLLKGTTAISFGYRYLGTDYQGSIERSGNFLFITVEESTHNIKKLYAHF